MKARATLDTLSDAEWTKITDAEKWPVGVTAHHFASVLEPISQLIEGLVAGKVGTLRTSMIDEMRRSRSSRMARARSPR